MVGQLFSIQQQERKTLSKFEIVISTLFVFGLILLSRQHYFIFHSLVEWICAIIGLSISIIALNTFKFQESDNLAFLGIVYAFIAGFSFLHIFTYEGINLFSDLSNNLTIQLSSVANYIEATAFLIVGRGIDKSFKMRVLALLYFVVVVISSLTIFLFKTYPLLYIEGFGQTIFGTIGFLIIALVYLVGAALFKKYRNDLDQRTKRLMVWILLVKSGSIIVYTFSNHLFDMPNMAAHIIKLISFYLIYKAVIESSLKKPYENLLRSNEKYRKVFDILPDSVVVFEDTKIVFANKAAANFLGHGDIKEMIGQDISRYAVAHPNDEAVVKKRERKLQQAENSIEFIEHKIVLSNDQVVDVEVGGVSFHDGGGVLSTIVFRDIRERKKNQQLKKKVEEEQKIIEKMKEYDQIKTQFFATISHELKTPLNIILGVIQLLNKSHQHPNECGKFSSSKRFIKMMQQNCYRLLRLINNLIDITKLDSGHFRMEFKNNDIVKVIEDVSLSVADYIQMHGIDLIFDTDIEEKIIACDAEKIERIMLNLLSNATKFTDRGGLIEVNVYDKADGVVISVKDTGIGIPEGMWEDIFDRFSQVDASFTRKKEGSGIGLSLVKSLVTSHGGEINVKSKVGEGSEFIIKLPSRQQNVQGNWYDDIACTSESKVERINVEFSDVYD